MFEQLALLFDRAVATLLPAAAPQEERFRIALRRRLPEAEVVFHQNRSTMLSWRRSSTGITLRLHRMFEQGDDRLAGALAEYVRHRSRRSSRLIDQFIADRRSVEAPLPAPAKPPPAPKCRGRVYALDQIFDALNDRYFSGAIDARIGWGRGAGRRARRRKHIRMGVYLEDRRTILLHPALDRPQVPRFFVEFVVYHEMLHQAVPSARGQDGRRCVHSREFRVRERLFDAYDQAIAWEKANLDLLLS